MSPILPDQPNSEFPPDPFDEITSGVAVTTPWRLLYDEAEAELLDNPPDRFVIEDIGRLAFSRLPEQERPEAMDCLFYDTWALATAEREAQERAQQVAAGSFLEPGDWGAVRVDLMGAEERVTVDRMALERVVAELERLQSALAQQTGGGRS